MVYYTLYSNYNIYNYIIYYKVQYIIHHMQGPPANRAIFKCFKKIKSIVYNDTVTIIRKYIL